MALSKEVKDRLIKQFAKHDSDTGSSEVQIATLCEGINELTKHCQANPQDFSSKRGLLKMVCQRRKFLDYLSKKDHAKYKEVIQQLGLRK